MEEVGGMKSQQQLVTPGQFHLTTVEDSEDSEDHLYINDPDDEEETTGEPEDTKGDTQTDNTQFARISPQF